MLKRLLEKCLIVLLLIIMLNCGLKENSESHVEKIGSKGIVKINLREIYYDLQELEIFNSDNSVFITMNGRYLQSGTVKLDLKEVDRDTLAYYIRCKVFDPEYNLFLLECTDKDQKYFHVLINDEIKLIDATSTLAEFQTTEEYVLKSYPILTLETPLFEKPDSTSNVIEGFINYNYISTEMNGDWLKVKCDLDCEGCPEGKVIEGWVKWRENDRILIKIGYSC